MLFPSVANWCKQFHKISPHKLIPVVLHRPHYLWKCCFCEIIWSLFPLMSNPTPSSQAASVLQKTKSICQQQWNGSEVITTNSAVFKSKGITPSMFIAAAVVWTTTSLLLWWQCMESSHRAATAGHNSFTVVDSVLCDQMTLTHYQHHLQ